MGFEGVEDAFALSPIQTGMLYDSLSAPDTDVYVTYVTAAIIGKVDGEVLRQAWQCVFSRHQALRAEFHWDGLDQPLQVIAREVLLPWKVLDWSGESAQVQENLMRQLVASERLQQISITAAPLSRFVLIKLHEEKWSILWCVHHLLADGLSTPTILEHVLESYMSLQNDKDLATVAVSDPVYQYSQHIHWLAGKDEQLANNYWRDRLLNSRPTPVRLRQVGDSDVELKEGDIPQIQFSLTIEKTADILHFCQTNRLTLSTFLHGAWALLLREYSGCGQPLFTSTVSGRHADVPGMENAVGLYLNAQPRWLDTDVETDLVDWLKDIQSEIHHCAKYDYASLRDIQKAISHDSDEQLFESIITIGGHPSELDLSRDGFDIMFTDIKYQSTQSHYDLAFLAFPGQSLEMSLVYNPQKFAAADIQLMSRYLVCLVDNMLSGYIETPASISKSIAVELNSVDYISRPPNRTTTGQTVHQWFESVADSHPDKVAIRFNGECVSFAELDARANQVARLIQYAELSTSAVSIGLMLPRSMEQIAAMLGILKSGAAYTPIDPDYPRSSIQTLLESGGISHVITTGQLAPAVELYGVKPLVIDDSVGFSGDRIAGLHCDGQSLAYVMFTSGSTGVPKGVQITHSNLVHSTSARIDYYKNPHPVFLLLSSIAFDSSVAGIYWCLCGGGTLVLPLPDQEKDINEIAGLIKCEAVSHTLCLPGYYHLLLQNTDLEELLSLDIVIVAGEACTPELVQLHFDYRPDSLLFNEYGPTEACVWSSVYQFRGKAGSDIPVGKAVGHTWLQVINDFGNVSPQGCEGEIVIGGPGVSQGYLNDPELTRVKFIENSIDIDKVPVVYKTGDLGYFNADGNLVFTGRVDRQVKIRGHRIEPAGVEAVLSEHPDISQSLVIAVDQSRLTGEVANLNRVSRKEQLAHLKQQYSDDAIEEAIEKLAISSEPPSSTSTERPA